ncbi:MAG TPA: D-alanyl-D-alanine carboxypeptidase family protein [Burkholderiales bacterium]|nr:D-alanyl-D-alanine carboxypeptidase family protein [Burkholderiales bacterium]
MSRCLAACLALLSGVALAAAPQPPVVDARAWLLLDATSGQSIASRNPRERIEPASLTKLMTAYLAFAALKGRSLALGQTIRVSERAWRTAGSRMFIEPRRPVTVEELLHGMIVQSGNDACIALAEAVAGSESAFVERMNREAGRLGMTDTNFTNSSGLPDRGHYSTASDLALLTSALIREYPEYYKLYSEREYRYNDITQRNRNQLLWLDPNVDGVKTGHTEGAGYSLIASARRSGRRLVSVVIGATSENLRARESQKLLNFGFQSYDTLRLYHKGDAIGKLQVWKGSKRELKAGAAAELYVTVPKGTADALQAELVSQQPLIAPLEPGQRVATLRVSHDGKPLAEYPVIALEGVAVAGFFARTWDSLRLWFRWGKAQ